MNCIFKRIYACIFAFCAIFVCSSCSAENDADSSNSASPKTYSVEFYKNNGYYELSGSDYLNFEIDSTCVACVDDTTLVKKGTIFYATAVKINSISVSAKASSGYSNYDFENQQILTGFEINDKFYDYDIFDNLGIKMSADIEIEAVFESFELRGFCIYYVNDENENAELFLEDSQEYLKANLTYDNGVIDKPSNTDEFIYCICYESEEDLKNNNLEIFKKINMDCDVQVDAGETNFILMLPNVEEAEFYIYLMAVDENGELVFISLGCAEKLSETTQYFDFGDAISSIYGLGNRNFVMVNDLYDYDSYFK